MDKPRQNRPRETTHKVSKERLYRAVASSCAIEGNLPVEVIERQLKAGEHRFSHLSLSL